MWNPDLYLKYEDERTQPSRDLASRINISNPVNVIDIGCGPGNSTKVLKDRWPDADIIGLDSSPEMIAEATHTDPQVHWILADVVNWAPETEYTIVFSNAALQWIPDQENVIKKLFGCVRSHGALAIQVPANSKSPLHQAVLQVSARKEWRDIMKGCETLLTYNDVSFYYNLLSTLTERIFVWATTYYHIMENHQGLMDWYAGTGLRPYLERLPKKELRHLFQYQILEACRSDYPVQPDGKILFPFHRLFIVAYNEST
ncbi:MAG: Trans-aconitate 2-methyltransferase [Syntrophus sp. SKADARSKE-3]|nr:Trans-aconitate 2-methyltransferase [Syntrophus sp. SKADARSKE-3]